MEKAQAERFADRLERIVTHFSQRSYRQFGHRGNTPRSQMYLLHMLDWHGPGRVSELADMLDVSSPAVTALTNELVKAGYCRRSEDPDDRRATRIEVTDAGRRAVQEVHQQRHAKAVQLLTHFEEAEIETFLKTVSRMTEIIAAQKEGTDT